MEEFSDSGSHARRYGAERWDDLAVEVGVAIPREQQYYKHPQQQDRIRLGFERVVAEIIYGDYGENWSTEPTYPHIIELLSDRDRLRELVTRWFEENYEPRMAARVAAAEKLGAVAMGR